MHRPSVSDRQPRQQTREAHGIDPEQVFTAAFIRGQRHQDSASSICCRPGSSLSCRLASSLTAEPKKVGSQQQDKRQHHEHQPHAGCGMALG